MNLGGSGHRGEIYTFAGFTFDTAAFALTKAGDAVHSEPQSLEILRYLLANHTRMVPRAELIEAIWGGRIVTDWAVSGAIRALRGVLGDTGTNKRLIQTVHGKGFRMAVPVSVRTTLVFLIEPFETLGADAPSYLAEGLAEDLISDLSALPNARVLSRAASLAIAAKPDLRHTLAISHIVSGNLRQSGQRLRLNLSLSQTNTQTPLWRDKLDGDAGDVFDLQDRASARLHAAIAPHLGTPTRPPRGTNNPLAYDAYLRGRSEYYRYTPPHMANAMAAFETATTLDPAFAEAFAQMAYCRCSLHVFDWPGSDATLGPAQALAERAVNLAPNAAVVHARLGWILGFLGQPDVAIAAFARAVACGGGGEVLYAYGETMNRLNLPDRAMPLLEQAFLAETFVPPTWAFAKGHSRLLLGDVVGALDHLKPVVECAPGFVPAKVQTVRALVEHNDPTGAQQMVELLRAQAPRYTRASARRMFPYPDPQQGAALDRALELSGLPD